MEVIDVDNVQQAIPEGCRLLLRAGVRAMTRNGMATVLPTPLTTVYRKPTQRVSFWAERDANPFFHLMECIWMLAGRRDVAWISRFSSNIANYSDDGVVFNGAYGYRWRGYFGVDQLAEIIRNLRVNPSCRRQVLSMWAVRDLVQQDTKDVPCNTSAYLQVSAAGALDLMVNNRSNDLIWGAYGANAVHFSFLLEVLATFIGVPVGRYYQVSMNTHLYDALKPKAEALAEYSPDPFSGQSHRDRDPYAWGHAQPYPVVANTQWFRDAETFMAGATRGYSNSFFPEVALPLLEAWNVYKEKGADWHRRSLKLAESCAATDWRRAAVDWLNRREPQ